MKYYDFIIYLRKLQDKRELCDCIIHYKDCNNIQGEYFGFRTILAYRSEYFKILFNREKQRYIEYENQNYLEYNIHIPFTEKSLLSCLSLIFDKEIKVNEYTTLEIYDLLKAMFFLQLSEDNIRTIVEILISRIESVNSDYQENVEIMDCILYMDEWNSDLKNNILNRLIHKFEKEQVDRWKTDYPVIFDNMSDIIELKKCSYYDETNKKLYLIDDNTNRYYIHDDLKYTIYTTYDREYREHGFWINVSPVGEKLGEKDYVTKKIEGEVIVPMRYCSIILYIYSTKKTIKAKLVDNNFYTEDYEEEEENENVNKKYNLQLPCRLESKFLKYSRGRYGHICGFDDYNFRYMFVVEFE